VLSDNIFSIKRNEGKYIKRNNAKRTQFVFEVFRPDIVDLMIEARKRLSSVPAVPAVPSVPLVYTDKDIKGLGKNYMFEESRKSGITAYTFYIKYYALKGFVRKLKELVTAKKTSQIAKVITTQTACKRWEHERAVLQAEFTERDIPVLLQQFADMTIKIAQDVEESKAKDDHRGVRVIPDYAEAHEAAKDNSFVKETNKEAEAVKKEINALIAKLK